MHASPHSNVTHNSGSSHSAMSLWSVLGILFALTVGIIPTGCAMKAKQSAALTNVALPDAEYFEREQLKIHSNFRIARRHRLIDELTAIRRDLCQRLLLPISDEPILVYIFDDAERFRRYLKDTYPRFPDRRAFFVKTDTELKVFAHWGDRVGEDLRHEVTHGYTHAVVPNIPLWMDEGFAEFFEVPRARRGVHREHIYLLTDHIREGWRPDLERLEWLSRAADLSQLDYAESWLWVHFMMETTEERRKLLQDQLARHRMVEKTKPLSEQLNDQEPDLLPELLKHLEDLAAQL